ncbi:hypothetical protein [Gracilibacillus sp. YIM 98692]|uniref:hypothetical protein n=1 Tax=Gracilibacillus sp. YIM 98692 TaxID=2663532 RepID=UPI0013D437C5|nr:hypothetical protein [Gracilibacillus sp. YIM 98692]
MDERKILLQQKIKVNKQKGQRKILVDMLPKDLSHVIENSDLITSPELEKVLNSVHERWNNELHTHDFIINYENHRKEFSWGQEVIQFVQGITIAEEQVYLFLGISDSPIFLVDGNWVIKNFRVLWQSINYEDVWIIGQDFNYGVLVSCYGGYLEHDPNPKEIFYAITKWNDD